MRLSTKILKALIERGPDTVDHAANLDGDLSLRSDVFDGVLDGVLALTTYICVERAESHVPRHLCRA